ncbi:MAG: KH domain-containing protein [Candidatus Hydrogenedentes bacterium]|nr:KH domain-containing protein [Candidatus Hydrogenedentota bacterium]
MAQLNDLVEFVAKKLVTHPEDVNVRTIESEEGQIVELRVNPEDMGKVIGKNGKTAKAMRSLLASATTKSDTRAVLQIVE